MAKHRFFVPWWLDDGTEICPICHHLYPYETGHHCANCDRAICHDCYEARKRRCGQCTEEDSESEISIEVTL